MDSQAGEIDQKRLNSFVNKTIISVAAILTSLPYMMASGRPLTFSK